MVEHSEPPYDFIFMDIDMPEMDGMTASNEILELFKRNS